MTRLLVSVRSAAEAEMALAAGVDLIDVKEPSRGSLGAADQATLQAVANTIGGRAPLSAALGELLDEPLLAPRRLNNVQYAKCGLAGCRNLADWPIRLQHLFDELPSGVTPVAVAYADWAAADAPPPARVLEEAPRLGCGAVLVDTYVKGQGGLTDFVPLPELRRFVTAARRAGLMIVLAGSLRATDFDRLLPLEPHYLAVRQAVCSGSREGDIDSKRIEQLLSLLRAPRVAHVNVHSAIKLLDNDFRG